MMTRIGLSISLVGSSVLMMAQHPFISDFSVEQVAGGVFVQWTLRAGSICQGIQLDRQSTGEENFVQIGSIEGVCGDVNSAVDYSLVDSNPEYGAENSYRLTLGSAGRTESVGVFVYDFNESEYVVYQDPMAEFISLIPRRKGIERTFVIYTIDGREVKRGVVSGASETSISIASLNKGIHILQITEGDASIFAKVFLTP